LANELDIYKGKGNQYMDDNIQEIQELYKNEEQEKKLVKGRVENKEVILIKLYKILELTTSSESSLINDEVNNLIEVYPFSHTDKNVLTTSHTINHSNPEKSKIQNSGKK